MQLSGSTVNRQLQQQQHSGGSRSSSHSSAAGFTLSPHAAAFIPSSWQGAGSSSSLSSGGPSTVSNVQTASHYSRPDWRSYRQAASLNGASDHQSLPNVAVCSNSSLKSGGNCSARVHKDTTPQARCSCKLLVTHKQAGAIIGKSGSEISHMEQAAKVSIKVSPSGSFFPGTQERVLVIFGESMNIREALQDIVAKFEYCNEILQVQEETKSPYFRDWDESGTDGGAACRARPLVMRLVVPNSAVGVLMGQQGSEIKHLAVGCGVHIQISPRINGVIERVVTITGTSARVLVAASEIMDAIQGNPHLFEHAINLTYSQLQHRAARSSSPPSTAAAAPSQAGGSISTASNASDADIPTRLTKVTMMRSNSLDSHCYSPPHTEAAESVSTRLLLHEEDGEEKAGLSRATLTAMQMQLLIDALVATLEVKGEEETEYMRKENEDTLFTLSSLAALGSSSGGG